MDLKDAIKAIRPSTVQIRTPTGVLGTGFFVAESGHIATANHVVEAAGNAGPLLIGLAHENTENMRANFTLVDAEIVATEPTLDLAILRPTLNPFAAEIGTGIVINNEALPLPHAVATLEPARPEDGEPVAISGYPLSNPALITTSGALASVWAYEQYERQVEGAPPGFVMTDVHDVFVADVQGNPGNSGGPAYRIDDGMIIGVCLQVRTAPTWNAEGEIGEFSANAGLTVLRPARDLVEFLGAVGIEFVIT
jgi:S1-C subfamily serine protease